MKEYWIGREIKVFPDDGKDEAEAALTKKQDREKEEAPQSELDKESEERVVDLEQIEEDKHQREDQKEVYRPKPYRIKLVRAAAGRSCAVIATQNEEYEEIGQRSRRKQRM